MRSSFLCAFFACVTAAFAPASRQEPSKDGTQPGSQVEGADESAPRMSPDEAWKGLLAAVHARPGPVTGAVGDRAEVAVPEGLYYSDGKGAQELLRMTGNIPGGHELAAVISGDAASGWFVLYDFDESGYVKDDEKDDLDADALLASMRENVVAGNEVRKERGLDTLELLGWEKPPFYDPKTHNLTWGTRVRSSRGGESVNWSVRVLGRKGVMSTELVVGPEEFQSVLPQFEELVAGFEYKDGQKYAQYVAGDHVAEYGLGALVLGGAGVAAAKLGLFGKLWKFLLPFFKFIALGLAAAAAFLKNSWKKLFGGKSKSDDRPPPIEGRPLGGG